MTIYRNIFALPILVSSLLLLSACGEGEGDSASAPAPAPSATTSAAPAAESMSSSSSMEKADGVVYQDEIYANWPYN